jgi:hypothetical protein
MSTFFSTFRKAGLGDGEHILLLWADRYPGTKSAFDKNFIWGVGSELKRHGRIVAADGTENPVTEASELLSNEDVRRRISESESSLLIVGDGGPDLIYDNRCRWRLLLVDVSSKPKRHEVQGWITRLAVKSAQDADAVFASIDGLDEDSIPGWLAVFHPNNGWIEDPIRGPGRPGIRNVLELAVDAVRRYCPSIRQGGSDSPFLDRERSL